MSKFNRLHDYDDITDSSVCLLFTFYLHNLNKFERAPTIEQVIPCPGIFLSCTFSLCQDQSQFLVLAPSPEYPLFGSSFSNTQQLIVLLKKTCSDGSKVYYILQIVCTSHEDPSLSKQFQICPFNARFV